MTADFGGPHGSTIADPPTLGRVVVNKTFAKPFRIVLMDGESRTRVFEVKTLAGLQSVVGRVDKGELFEMGKFGAITMQLWGFLAEHCGFMTVTTPRTMEAGLGVLGPSAALVDDMADLCGGVDAGVEMLREARRMAGVDVKPGQIAPELVKQSHRQGVVEVTDTMIGRIMDDPLYSSEAEAAAIAYKKLVSEANEPEFFQAESDSTNHAQRTLAADQAAIDRHKLMESQKPVVEDYTSAYDKPSGSEQAPQTGLDEQGAP